MYENLYALDLVLGFGGWAFLKLGVEFLVIYEENMIYLKGIREGLGSLGEFYGLFFCGGWILIAFL